MAAIVPRQDPSAILRVHTCWSLHHRQTFIGPANAQSHPRPPIRDDSSEWNVIRYEVQCSLVVCGSRAWLLHLAERDWHSDDAAGTRTKSERFQTDQQVGVEMGSRKTSPVKTQRHKRFKRTLFIRTKTQSRHHHQSQEQDVRCWLRNISCFITLKKI